MKDTLIKIEKNLWESALKWMKPRTKSVIWNIRKQKQTKNNTQSEPQEGKLTTQNEDSVRILWNNFKCTNICIMGVLKGEEREQEIGNLFQKIRTENFPNLVKEIDIQVQGVQRDPNKMNPKKPTPRHIITKMQKVKNKERILKATREKPFVT